MRPHLPLVVLACLSGGCTTQPAPTAVAATRPASILASSSPAPDSVTAEPVYSLQLRFDPPARLDELLVDGPAGTAASMIHAVGERDSFTVPIDAPGPGAYTVRWCAHVGTAEHRGQFRFTVR